MGEDRAIGLFLVRAKGKEAASSFPGTTRWLAPLLAGKIERNLRTTTTSNRPSKPWACRSRRCRRRTWRSCEPPIEAWNAGDMDAVRVLYDPDVDRADRAGVAGAGAVRRSGSGHAPVEQNREAWDADTLEPIERLHRRGRPRCREVDRRGGAQGPEVEHWRSHGRLHGAQGKDHLAGVLLGPRGGPRSRGAVGARRSRRPLSLRDTARAMSQENVEAVRELSGR